MKVFNFLLLSGLFLLFFSCKKDQISFSGPNQPNKPITLDITNAKSYYQSLKNTTERNDTIISRSEIIDYIEPLWDYAQILQYLDSIPILIVPCGQCYDKRPYNDTYLAFYSTTEGIKCDLVLLQTKTSIALDRNFFANYSGRMILFDLEQKKFRKLLTFNNGNFESILNAANLDGGVQDRSEDCFALVLICTSEIECSCYSVMWEVPCWGSPSGTTFYWDGSGGGNSTGNNGNGNNPVVPPDPTGWSGGYNGTGVSGGGGGNNSSITNYFDPQFFEGAQRKLMVNINNLLKRECISNITNQKVQNCAEEYLQHCTNGLEPLEAALELMEEMSNNNYSPCLQQIINNQIQQTLAEQKHNFQTKYGYNPSQASNCFTDPCTPAENESCALEQLTQSWLAQHPEHNAKIQVTLADHPNSPDVVAHIQSEVIHMMADDNYRQFVEATWTWPPIMWEIAKELVGDKCIDILANFLGLGQAANVKDAIKALKNSDWIDFTTNVGEIVFKNSPLGKWLSGLEAGKNLYDLYKWVERIWDKIDSFGEAALERIWNIAKNIPGDLKFNPNYLKYVGDLDVPKLGGQFANATNYNSKFKTLYPEVANQISQVHHAVPQWVINRYPHLNITMDQMHSLENLRGIPVSGNLDHATITNYWEAFYNTNPTPTLQEVLDFAKLMDDEFGHLFIPPVR